MGTLPIIVLSGDQAATIQQIIAAINASGFSEAGLARKTGVSRNTIRTVKKGRSTGIDRGLLFLNKLGYGFVIPAQPNQSLAEAVATLTSDNQSLRVDTALPPKHKHWLVESITIKLPTGTTTDDDKELAFELNRLCNDGWEPIYISPGICLSQKRIYHIIVKRLINQ